MLLATGACVQPDSAPGTGKTTASSGGTTTSVAASTLTGINAIQIITKGDSTGSFDNVVAPVSGGTLVKAQRIYDLDGSLISSGNIPTWYSETRAFLTSTRTAGTANPATPSAADTPCAYFDAFTDNNPDTSGFFTVDGYNPEIATGGSDIDQCAGTAAAELSQLAMYIKVDRRFMNAGDKLQVIVKAKAIDEPNTAPTTSSCVVGGFFDASACSNQLYTLSLRSAPAASTKPFFILFPSAKALDLLSEAILLPMPSMPTVTTISIDRVKGGVVIYGLTLIRM